MVRRQALREELPAEIEIDGAAAPCSYLPPQTARMTYRLAYRLPEARYEHLLARGWRRFGRTLFRPTCAACRECRGLRVVIPEFQPSKSQRRCWRKNEGIDVVVQSPTLTVEHLSLYNRYHQDMHGRRHWAFREITAEQYIESFLDGNFPFSREFQYRDKGRLVGLGIVDVTATAMSSIYFFHDPDYRDAALGTFSVMCEIDEGQRTQKSCLYMGYWIRDCQSMNYKNRFQPNELLRSFVADKEDPLWEKPAG